MRGQMPIAKRVERSPQLLLWCVLCFCIETQGQGKWAIICQGSGEMSNKNIPGVRGQESGEMGKNMPLSRHSFVWERHQSSSQFQWKNCYFKLGVKGNLSWVPISLETAFLHWEWLHLRVKLSMPFLHRPHCHFIVHINNFLYFILGSNS